MYTAIVRSAEHLKDRGILDVFLNHKTKVPIYYQYCQTANPKKTVDEDNIIGYARNIRKEGHNIVCDVDLFVVNPLSANFESVIDNYTLTAIRSNGSNLTNYSIVRFNVYNKEFKRKVDKRDE